MSSAMTPHKIKQEPLSPYANDQNTQNIQFSPDPPQNFPKPPKTEDLNPDTKRAIKDALVKKGISQNFSNSELFPEQKVYKMTKREMDKKERRKEQNRRAATRCRIKKRDQLRLDQQKANLILNENKSLSEEIPKLQADIAALTTIIQEHLLSGYCHLPASSTAFTQLVTSPIEVLTSSQQVPAVTLTPDQILNTLQQHHSDIPYVTDHMTLVPVDHNQSDHMALVPVDQNQSDIASFCSSASSQNETAMSLDVTSASDTSTSGRSLDVTNQPIISQEIIPSSSNLPSWDLQNILPSVPLSDGDMESYKDLSLFSSQESNPGHTLTSGHPLTVDTGLPALPQTSQISPTLASIQRSIIQPFSSTPKKILTSSETVTTNINFSHSTSPNNHNNNNMNHNNNNHHNNNINHNNINHNHVHVNNPVLSQLTVDTTSPANAYTNIFSPVSPSLDFLTSLSPYDNLLSLTPTSHFLSLTPTSQISPLFPTSCTSSSHQPHLPRLPPVDLQVPTLNSNMTSTLNVTSPVQCEAQSPSYHSPCPQSGVDPTSPFHTTGFDAFRGDR